MTAYWNGRKACIKVTFHKQTTNGGIFPVRPFFLGSIGNMTKIWTKVCAGIQTLQRLSSAPLFRTRNRYSLPMSSVKIHLTFIRGYAILLYID